MLQPSSEKCFLFSAGTIKVAIKVWKSCSYHVAYSSWIFDGVYKVSAVVFLHCTCQRLRDRLLIKQWGQFMVSFKVHFCWTKCALCLVLSWAILYLSANPHFGLWYAFKTNHSAPLMHKKMSQMITFNVQKSQFCGREILVWICLLIYVALSAVLPLTVCLIWQQIRHF